MSISDCLLREALKGRRPKEYPEGDDRVWAIIEGAFAGWCAAVIVICLVIAGA